MGRKCPNLLFQPPVVRYFVGLLAMHHIRSPEKKSFIQNYGTRTYDHSRYILPNNTNASEEHTLSSSEALPSTILTGGCVLYGKPGRVVVEGPTESSVRLYLRAVRKLHWQKCVEMGVFPSEEVMLPEMLRDRFNFMDEELEIVSENKRLHSAIISSPLVHSKKHESKVGFVKQAAETPDDDVGAYINKRVRPSAHLFPFDNEMTTGDFLRVFETDQELKDYLTDECGSPELWVFINQPFSGIRVTNYCQDERF
eukprot:Tbor_TRINITY_DN3445_c0_g1::TRINITY_DN3445_c0_g1_i1::g.3749::m.3749